MRDGPISSSARLAVVCDFDGTITEEQTGRALLDAFAPPAWRTLAPPTASFTPAAAQDLTSAQFSLVRGSETEVRRWVATRAADVPLRPGIHPFLAWCATQEVPVTIASAGIDLYVHPILEAAHLRVTDVRCGRSTWTAKGLNISFDHLLSADFPGERDIKRLAVLSAQAGGHFVVLVGDGPGDLPAAEVADLVLARDELVAFVRNRGITHREFTDFTDVVKAVGGLTGRQS